MNQYEIDLKIAMENGIYLKCIKNQDYRVCIEALKENGRALEYVRCDSMILLEEEIKQICLTAVRKNGDSIKYINWNKLNLKTEDIMEICIEAVKRNRWAFKNIHWVQIVKNLSEEQIYLICIEAITSFGEVLKYMNWDLLNLTDKQVYNLCLEAVGQEAWNIAYINNNLSPYKKNKLYLIAIKQNLDVIIFIDKENRDMFKYNILKEAFRNRKVIAIFIDGRWLFTIGCQNNITKEEFIYRIYNTDGGFDLEKGINVHRKIYLDFLEQFL
ncbi:hypothetical protein NBN67_19205 [Clostridioides difficile]|uniref:hypothetical protein n=1 Tax=Clostridioides difficile TaxID=1496 RepID=UPI00202DEBCD|nr:hypothetical protein [Clostridioides difficile]MCM0739665.1 hypothetical protein [Clostridioides difficile]HBF2930538.1 hypothetical protein [Clostridioides difficile]HBF2935922.1 hypothetical protein [Clostridioides difficile]HBZ0282718.1 hypothetical protein [Clostridioides difficile]